MAKQQVPVHQDFAVFHRWYMTLGLNKFMLPVLRLAMRSLEKKSGSIEGVSYEDLQQGNLNMRIFSPDTIRHPAASLWIHGGGMIVGSPRTQPDHNRCGQLAQTLGIRVFSLGYRLAPENPFPAAVDDVYQSWCWVRDNAERYGIDPLRIAIGGESAGGNIAAALTQRIRDEGGIQPAAQYLSCPCLNDRTGLDESLAQKKYAMLNVKDVHYAWKCYLGEHLGKDQQPAYAVPGLTENLNGLPPAWIGVGVADVLYRDGVDYAHRLKEAGVPVELEEVKGVPHGFDSAIPDSELSIAFRASQYNYLRKQLRLD